MTDYFLGLQNHCRWWLQPWNQKALASWKKSYDQPRQRIKKQTHYFVNKGLSSQGYGFSSSHVRMWELNYKEGWVPRNWSFQTMVWEKTLESPWDSKEIQPVHSEDQPWYFFGGNDAKAETPVLWPPHVKSWLIGKNFDAGRDWGQEEKGTTEDEMAGWHHWLDEREFEWTPGVGDGQGGLARCNSWGCKELDTTEQLNWTELKKSRGAPCFWNQEVECCHQESSFSLHLSAVLSSMLASLLQRCLLSVPILNSMWYP